MRQASEFIQYMTKWAGNAAAYGESRPCKARLTRNLWCPLIAAMAAVDGPQSEKLRRVVGDQTTCSLSGRDVEPADSDHRIGGDERDGSKAIAKRGSQTEEGLAFLSGNT